MAVSVEESSHSVNIANLMECTHFLIHLFSLQLHLSINVTYPQEIVTGFGGEAIFMLVVAYTKSDTTAVFALILAVGSSGFAISGFA